jgi:single-strand DNA-binding protein
VIIINKVILIGRLVRDPELKKTNTDIYVTQFTIAVNRNYKTQNGETQADFINCVTWRGLAENLCKYMRKGNAIAVDGEIQTRKYQDQQGTDRWVTEVICNNIVFLESKPKEQTQQTPTISNNNVNNNPFDTKIDPFANVPIKNGISDDDLPF